VWPTAATSKQGADAERSPIPNVLQNHADDADAKFRPTSFRGHAAQNGQRNRSGNDDGRYHSRR